MIAAEGANTEPEAGEEVGIEAAALSEEAGGKTPMFGGHMLVEGWPG